MQRNHSKPRFDRRSPVQPGRSAAPYLIVAIVAALAVWGVQQCSIQNSRPEREADQNAPVRVESYTTGIPEPIRGDVRTVFSDSDYPAEAQRNGEEGTVQARLDIDGSGRVARCTVIRSSGHELLDSATCSILRRRARFEPTRDGTTYVTPPVTWRLGE